MTNYEWLKQLVEYLRQHPTDECIEWPFSHNGRYGKVWVNSKRKRISAHRIAFELDRGHPPKHCVLHRNRCHNTLCINPSHLKDGTQKQNMDDKIADGTRGWKLDECKVDQIIHLIEDGINMSDIADEFGVSRSSIGSINAGRCWNHVRRANGKTKKIRKRGNQYKLTPDEVEYIHELLDRGEMNQAAIARQFGLSEATISRIKNGSRWHHLSRPQPGPGKE